MPESMPPVSPTPTDAIHDIGYRHYDGPRLGASYIRRALFLETFRGAFGLGRSARSKVMPFLLLAVMVLPAAVIGIVTGYFGFAELPLNYTAYVFTVQVAVTIFLGAQSPAAMSRDLRFRVAALYFSRPLSRRQYVQAKYAGMAAALFVLMGLPVTLLLAGALLAELSLGDQLPDYLRAMGGVVVYALVLAGVGLVVAAMTPRRGLGVAAVVGVLLVLSGIQATVRVLAEELGDETLSGYAGLISPYTLVDGVASGRLRCVAHGEPGSTGRPRGHRLRRRRRGAGGRQLCRAGRPLPVGALMSILELAQVSRWFGNVVAVNDVTMRLGPGVTGLLGPNGAGKSTLIHMMAGFLAPSAGSVTLDDRPLFRDEQIYREIGLVPEREEMYDAVTGWRFVLANARLHRLPDPEAAARRAIDIVDMAAAQDRDIRTYSKGMKQRIKIATAIVHDPTVLLLDEPFNGMDPRQRLHLMDLLRAARRTGPHDPVQLAHPRGGRADRRPHRGDGRRTARRLRGLPRDPPADDPAPAPVHDPLQRRPRARLGRDRGAEHVRRRAGQRPGRRYPGAGAGDGLLPPSSRALPRVASQRGIRLLEVLPADESLESVFSYLVAR